MVAGVPRPYIIIRYFRLTIEASDQKPFHFQFNSTFRSFFILLLNFVMSSSSIWQCVSSCLVFFHERDVPFVMPCRHKKSNKIYRSSLALFSLVLLILLLRVQTIRLKTTEKLEVTHTPAHRDESRRHYTHGSAIIILMVCFKRTKKCIYYLHSSNFM